jgi:hypothetical protein
VFCEGLLCPLSILVKDFVKDFCEGLCKGLLCPLSILIRKRKKETPPSTTTYPHPPEEHLYPHPPEDQDGDIFF